MHKETNDGCYLRPCCDFFLFIQSFKFSLTDKNAQVESLAVIKNKTAAMSLELMSDLPLSATRAPVWVRRGVGARWETVRNLSQCVGASPSQGPKEELQNKHIPT